MLLIADSSPLIALFVADSLTLLDNLYEDVRVPQSVFEEVTSVGKPGNEILYSYLKDKISEKGVDDMVLSDYSLGQGEVEAMLLYKRLKANLLLIDDKRARKIAELNGINTIGTFGVLLEAKEKKIITAIRPAIMKILNSNVYVSIELCNYVLKISDEKEI